MKTTETERIRAIKDIKESRKLYGLSGTISEDEIKFSIEINRSIEAGADDDISLFLYRETDMEPDIKTVRRVKLKKLNRLNG